MPGSIRRDFRTVTDWGKAVPVPGPCIVLCQTGQKLEHGVAAHLRAMGVSAEVLEGGFEAWRDSQPTLVPEGRLSKRDAQGRTNWAILADAMHSTGAGTDKAFRLDHLVDRGSALERSRD